MTTDLPIIGQVNRGVPYRTDPPLTVGTAITGTRSLIVGQNDQKGSVDSAMLLGSVMELTQGKSYLNWGVWLDVRFPHVMLIVGKRGSGKSYDLGIIAEGLCATGDSTIARGTDSFAMILFDTQSQFWTLAEPITNIGDQQAELISKWQIADNSVKTPIIYRPRGTPQIGAKEEEFALRPSDLEPDDWTALCNVERFTAMGQCLYKARAAMPENFSVGDMIEWLRSDEAADEHGENTREAVRWRLEAQASTNLFDKDAEDICLRLGTAGAKSIIQLADLDEDVKALVVAVVMRKLLHWAGPAQRRRKMALMRGEDPPADDKVAPRIWALIDEAHLICPNNRPTAARPVIVDYVKRGRDAGLSLVLATQQPSALDTSAISQSDIVIIHKLTIDGDIRAAEERMPAKKPKTIQKSQTGGNLADMDQIARTLDSGQSLFADTECSRAFLLLSRPRVTPHGGGEPPL